jgi:hypothetical protein
MQRVTDNQPSPLPVIDGLPPGLPAVPACCRTSRARRRARCRLPPLYRAEEEAAAEAAEQQRLREIAEAEATAASEAALAAQNAEIAAGTMKDEDDYDDKNMKDKVYTQDTQCCAVVLLCCICGVVCTQLYSAF